MEDVEPGVWIVAFRAPADQPLTYKYNRNNGGYSTDEEFTPDSPDARRSIEVARDELRVRDKVEAWRWLFPRPLDVTIPRNVPKGLPERREPFVARARRTVIESMMRDFPEETKEALNEYV